MINHILLEIYCLKGDNSLSSVENSDAPQCCFDAPRYDCLLNNCPFLSFTSCENSLCYIIEDSEAEEIISFGGEMEGIFSEESKAIASWKRISTEKIEEAYKEYMGDNG